MICDKFTLKGTPTFKLYDEFGVLKHEFTKPNLIVVTGREWIVKRLSSSADSLMSHIAIGSSNTTVGAGNTALGTETGRVAMVTFGGVQTGPNILYTANLGPGVGTGTVAEAGVFNAASGGIMLSRVSFTAFTKAPLDTMYVQWLFTQG
jgi:hypothetical protein